MDKQTANWKSSHDWIVTLDIDLATFCDMWSSKEPQLTSTLPPPSTPIDALVVLSKPAKIYLKWWAIQLAINSRVGTLKDLE